jgi:hypothetical protein
MAPQGAARRRSDPLALGENTVMSELKRHHHYVWQRYLKAWASDGKVWCRRSGKTFASDTQNLAQQRDFYQLKPLSARDREFLWAMIGKQDPVIRETTSELLRFFELACDFAALKPRPETDPVEFEKFRAQVIHNLEEDMFGRLESQTVPFLKQLLAGDASCLYSSRMEFLQFLSIQYTRTKVVHERVMKNLALSTTNLGVNIESCWPVLRHAFAFAMAWTLSEDKRMQIHLVSAPAGKTLVTCDQPVINTKALSTHSGIAPKETELYYPIGPHRAVVVSDDAKWNGSGVLLSGQVDRLNAQMVANSVEMVFASTQAQAVAA